MHSNQEVSQSRPRLVILALLVLLLLLIGAAPTQAADSRAKPASQPPASGSPTLGPGAASGPGTLRAAFAQAGAEFSVPPALLEAVGYVETHWYSRDGAPNDYAQVGVMSLRLPPTGDSLARAAKLLGADPATVQHDTPTNIRAAAALLHRLAQSSHAALESLPAWYPVVAAYSDIPDPVVARSYAYSVFSLLQTGLTAVAPGGETLTIPASSKLVLPDTADPLGLTPNSDDYPPAHWVAANSNNFQLGRQYGPLNFIVIHDTEGSYQSAISWFQNPSSGVSAHFVTRSNDGDITQMVHNADTAYHAGNWDYNVRAIGVEHEGYQGQPGWYTNAMYNASAALVRTMADRFGIHKDHAHIIGHYQVPNQSPPAHTDPGPNWDWAGYLARVRNDSAMVARVDNTDSDFAAFPGTIDPAHGWSIYSGGFGTSNAYRALSTTGPATNSGTWTASLPAGGLYDVYAYIPWLDNGRAETSSAHYTLATINGPTTVTLNQKAITDAGNGNGEWAHIGRFNLPSYTSVSLDNATSDSALNVWFDAVMWIPAGNVASPTPAPTNPPGPTYTPAPTSPPAPTRTPVLTRTPVSTNTPTALPPTNTSTSSPTATWTPGPCGMTFTDLPDTYWAYPYVALLYCQGIINGYSDSTFRPVADANRGQLAKMLSLTMLWYIPTPTVPTFSDVPPDSPYFYYVEDAYAHGAISGYSDATFRPFNPVTRAQISKMISIAKNWAQITPNPPSFSDIPADFWATGYVEAVYAQGVVSGYSDGTFRPANMTTRAQLSKMLANALQLPNGTPVPITTTTATPVGTPLATNTPLAAPSATGTPINTPIPTDTPFPPDASPTATP
ncbi:MAG: S-layer homology domain-containing protein [Chloroflexia bacterium]